MAPDPKAAEEPERDPWDLTPLFDQLDKFCNHILSLPAAANHPDIRAQLDFINANKEKLMLAKSEELAHRKAHEERLTSMTQTAKEKEAAHRKAMDELGKPLPSIDGSVLGEALLKNLGMGRGK
jgi:hypothetical protein